MTDLDRDEQLFVSTLHDRPSSPGPDLAGIAARACAEGARIRRRRRAGAGLAGAACAGLVLGGVFLLPGLGADPTATEPGSLAGPAPEPTAEPTADPGCPEGAGLRPPPPGVDPSADRDRPHALQPPPVRPVCQDTYPNPGPQDLAFTIAVPEGWTCDDPGDHKFGCRSSTGALLSVIQRPADDHDRWATDPDKGGPGTGVLVSAPHGGVFVSLQPNPGASTADAEQIAEALTWNDGTPVF